jgi:hypothetical protein
MFGRVLLTAALSLWTIAAASAADLETVKKDKAPETVPVKDASFFLFSDTQISYRYQFPTVSPGVQILRPDGSFVSREAPKHILGITHADAWAYGTNFFSLDILKSGSQFPAGTTNPPGSIASPFFEDFGNTEAYGLYRGTLSLNALTSSKAFAIPGFIKDVSLAFGFDANSQNDAFGSKKRDVVGGLNFAFDVPAGFLNLSTHAYKEWNRNGFNLQPDRDQSFDVVPEFEIVYNFPLAFTNLPLSITGIVLPKGRGVQNVADFAFNPKRGLEFLSRTNLVLDLGKLIYDQPNRVDVFIGFQYWLNKFGNVETASFKGTEEKSFLAGFAFHVF